MVKVYRFLTRRVDMTHDEAVRIWTEEHAPLVVSALGDRLSKYVTNVGLPLAAEEGGPDAPPWDGVDELWLDMTVDELKDAYKKAAPVLGPSEHKFLGNSQWMLVDEIVQRDDVGRPWKIKLIEPLVRRRDQDWDTFVDYWLHQHAPLVKETWGDGIVHYTTNPGLGNPFNWRMPEEGPPYDGIAQFHFAWDLDEYRQVVADTANVLVPDERAFVTSWRAVLVDEIAQK